MSKELIVETAIRLIDERGLGKFSVRNLAKTLNCYPTAIYWYTPSRHLLIAEIITKILSDVMPDSSLGWQEWLRALFYRYRHSISRHPNVAPLIGGNLVSNASVKLDLVEGVLSKLKSAGIDDALLIDAYNAVIGAMVGFATQEFAMLPPDPEELKQDLENLPGTVDAESYPILSSQMPDILNAAYILRWDNGAKRPLDGGFELYVDALIAGLEVKFLAK